MKDYSGMLRKMREENEGNRLDYIDWHNQSNPVKEETFGPTYAESIISKSTQSEPKKETSYFDQIMKSIGNTANNVKSFASDRFNDVKHMASDVIKNPNKLDAVKDLAPNAIGMISPQLGANLRLFDASQKIANTDVGRAIYERPANALRTGIKSTRESGQKGTGILTPFTPTFLGGLYRGATNQEHTSGLDAIVDKERADKIRSIPIAGKVAEFGADLATDPWMYALPGIERGISKSATAINKALKNPLPILDDIGRTAFRSNVPSNTLDDIARQGLKEQFANQQIGSRNPLLLRESPIRQGGEIPQVNKSSYLPQPKTKADFYALPRGAVAKNIDDIYRPNEPLMLPEGKITPQKPMTNTINRVITQRGDFNKIPTYKLKNEWEYTPSEFEMSYYRSVDSLDSILPKQVVESIKSKYKKIEDAVLSSRNDFNGISKISKNNYNVVDELPSIKNQRINNERNFNTILRKEVQEPMNKEVNGLIQAELKKRHKMSVENAVNSGKIVPNNVLKEYPYLQKKYNTIRKNGVLENGELSNVGRKTINSDIEIKQVRKDGKIYNQETITQKGFIPEDRNFNIRNPRIETPFQVTKGELKRGKGQGVELPANARKLSDSIQKPTAKEINKSKKLAQKQEQSFNQGKYANVGNKYEFPNSPSQYTPDNTYSRNVGMKENVSQTIADMRRIKNEKTPVSDSEKFMMDNYNATESGSFYGGKQTIKPKAPKNLKPIQGLKTYKSGTEPLKPQPISRESAQRIVNDPMMIKNNPSMVERAHMSLLPENVDELTKIVSDLADQQSKGIKINLQLFAAAQKKLKQFQSKFPQNTEVIDIVSGQQKDGSGLKEKIKKNFNQFYTDWVNGNNSIDKLGESPKVMAANAKKVGGTVDHIINKGLVNTNGEKIGESLKDIVTDIPAEKQKDFLYYLVHKHNPARIKQGNAAIGNYTEQQSIDMAKSFEQSNPEFIDLGKRMRTFLDDFSNTWLKDTGLTSESMIDELRNMYPDYIPTNREFSQLEKGFSTGNKSGFVDQGNTIKKATGSDRNIVNPIENIMNLINRTVRTARKNEVGQSILKAVEEQPNKLKEFAEVLPPDYSGKLDLDNIVRVLVKGEPVHLKINNEELLKAITGVTDSNLQGNKLLSATTNLYKGLITQKNPIFAIRNIARDVPQSYIYGSEKNPFAFGRDLVSATKDIITNSKIKQQYNALGGGQAGFFNPSDSTKALKKLTENKTLPKKILSIPGKAISGIEKFNALTETAPRLAEFKRTLKNTGDVQKALFNSGEVTTNFSRGGDKAKSADKFVPYLNASIQGLDRFARGVKDKPLQFTGKAITAITAPTVIQEIYNSKVDPEGYKNLDNRTKDNYFVFAVGDGEFLKVPKARETAVLFSSLFQRLYRASKGEEGAFKGFGGTVATNFSPTNPIENNIASPILNLKSNKDFADRPIVPQYMLQDGRSPGLQYDERTTEIAKKIGEVTNLSPKQIDYIVKSYSGVIGQLGQPMNTKGGSPAKAITTQFKSDSNYSSQALTNFYDNKNKLMQKASDKNITENIPSKKTTTEEKFKNVFNNASSDITKYKKQINEINNKDMDRGTKDTLIKDKQKQLNEYVSKLNEALKNNDLRLLKSTESKFKTVNKLK